MQDELSKLVHPASMGIALLAQTATILSVTAGTWTLMYFYSPSKSLRVRFPKMNNVYLRVESFIQRQVYALPPKIRNSNVVDWNRFVTSGAEAWVLRRPLVPFTYAASMGVGVFVGTKFHDWRFGSKDNMNEQNINAEEGDTMFGWNKIERGPSTDTWKIENEFKDEYDKN